MGCNDFTCWFEYSYVNCAMKKSKLPVERGDVEHQSLLRTFALETNRAR